MGVVLQKWELLQSQKYTMYPIGIRLYDLWWWNTKSAADGACKPAIYRNKSHMALVYGDMAIGDMWPRVACSAPVDYYERSINQSVNQSDL